MLQTFCHCHPLPHLPWCRTAGCFDRCIAGAVRKSGAVSAQLEVLDTQPLAQDMLRFWEAAKNMIKPCQVAGCLHVL